VFRSLADGVAVARDAARLRFRKIEGAVYYFVRLVEWTKSCLPLNALFGCGIEG